MSVKKILMIAAGGTILKQQQGQKMAWSVEPAELVEQACPGLDYSLQTIYTGLSASFDIRTVLDIAKLALETPCNSIVITVGTDVLEEVSYVLSYLLGNLKKVVITASMRPYGRDGYEGVANLRDAVTLATDEEGPLGVFVVINEKIFSGRTIFKFHSSRFDAFHAQPGPVGEVISGSPVFAFTPKEENVDGFQELTGGDLGDVNVPILFTHMNMRANNFQFETCDGLVVAAMGAGSVPTDITEFLADDLVKRIPIVISTRCPIGPNHAESMYTGSVDKYTSRGFIVREFTGLNALQSRAKLHLDIGLDKHGIAQPDWLNSTVKSASGNLK